MHALLATGAVHQHLVKTGLRCKCNLLIETGTAREPHHFACLIGYGATAVYPYMAYQVAVRDDAQGTREAGLRRAAGTRSQLPRAACARACSRSCRRWASPPSPAIAARSCSRSSGLADEVVELCFTGTESAACRVRTSPISKSDIAAAGAARVEPARTDWPGRPAQVRARRRVPHVQPGRHRRPAGGGDLRRLRPLPAVRAAGERAPRRDLPRPARPARRHAPDSAGGGRAGRGACSPASTAPACPWARSRPRRTRRWRSP